MKIAILILAAGQSSRMKRTKQLLPIGNNTLLGTVIQHALNTKRTNVYCVLGAESEKIKSSIQKYNLSIIINREYKQGMSTSIKKGVEFIVDNNYDGVFVILGDQPLIDTNYLNKVVETFNANPNKIVATKYSNVIGVPALFPKTYFNLLKNLSGDKGAREILNKNENLIALSTSGLLDIDTKAQYDDFIKMQIEKEV